MSTNVERRIAAAEKALETLRHIEQLRAKQGVLLAQHRFWLELEAQGIESCQAKRFREATDRITGRSTGFYDSVELQDGTKIELTPFIRIPPKEEDA